MLQFARRCRTGGFLTQSYDIGLTIVQGGCTSALGHSTHPRPTAGSSRCFPLSLFLPFSRHLRTSRRRYRFVYWSRMIPALVHIAPPTHMSPLPYSDFIVIGTRSSRHFEPSPFRRLGAKLSTYTMLRRHGGTRAVLGTQAVWTGCPRMDRLYRYPLQRTTGNSRTETRVPPTNRDPRESLSFDWSHGVGVWCWISLWESRLVLRIVCPCSISELIRKDRVRIIEVTFFFDLPRTTGF